jgi:phosphoglycolate phosphatase
MRQSAARTGEVMKLDIVKYRHIVWDWNGTLLDDSALCVAILNEMLSARGMRPVTMAQYRRHFDFPVIDYYRTLGFDFEEESYDAIAREFIDAYDERRFSCRLQAGAEEAVKRIALLGLPQSILSAYQQPRLEEVVGHFGMRKYFHILSGLSDDYAHSKVESGRRLPERLGCEPSELLLIGDTTHDHEVATAMGADCILIVSGHQDRMRLEKCGVPVLDSLKELLAAI